MAALIAPPDLTAFAIYRERCEGAAPFTCPNEAETGEVHYEYMR
jgi:hypothetical protein